MSARLRPCQLLVALALALTAAAAFAQADIRAEIERMYRAGETAQAMQRLDAALASKPDDADLRFLNGVMLAEQQRPAEAIVVYERLTQDFPGLAEPFNNLAVLYAAEGRLDKARDALEAALRNDPRYATAYENLGDVYLRLAVQAYEHSGANTPSRQRKLRLTRDLLLRSSGDASGS